MRSRRACARFLARQRDVTGSVFEAFDENLDLVARLDLDSPVIAGDLRDRQKSF